MDITQGSSALDAAAGKKSYDLEVSFEFLFIFIRAIRLTSSMFCTLQDNDPFWTANYDAQFPKVAEEVENELAAYKKAIAEVNAQT